MLPDKIQDTQLNSDFRYTMNIWDSPTLKISLCCLSKISPYVLYFYLLNLAAPHSRGPCQIKQVGRGLVEAGHMAPKGSAQEMGLL